MATDAHYRVNRMNWRSVVLRSALLALAAAFALEAALWLMWWYGADWMRELIGGRLFDLYMPAVVLAIALSGGNPHNINEAVAFLAELLQTFLMIFPLAVGIAMARFFARRHRQRHS